MGQIYNWTIRNVFKLKSSVSLNHVWTWKTIQYKKFDKLLKWSGKKIRTLLVSKCKTWISGSIFWIIGWFPQYFVSDTSQTVPAHRSSFLLLYKSTSKSFLIIASLAEAWYSALCSLCPLGNCFDTQEFKSPIRKFEAVDREVKLVLRIVSALTGTPPHKKESASPAAKRISSAWNYGYIHETHSSTQKENIGKKEKQRT